jgi:hypothetical protein
VFFTIPAIGWAPKVRAPLCGFSVKKYGAQDDGDPRRVDCGGGTRHGADIPADPTDTSRRVGPEYVSGFLRRLLRTRRAAVTASASARPAHQSPRVVIAIDNEPDLWHGTHSPGR